MNTDIEIDTDNKRNQNETNQIFHTVQKYLLASDNEDMCNQCVVHSNLWLAFFRRDELKPRVGNCINKDGVVMKG